MVTGKATAMKDGLKLKSLLPLGQASLALRISAASGKTNAPHALEFAALNRCAHSEDAAMPDARPAVFYDHGHISGSLNPSPIDLDASLEGLWEKTDFKNYRQRRYCLGASCVDPPNPRLELLQLEVAYIMADKGERLVRKERKR